MPKYLLPFFLSMFLAECSYAQDTIVDKYLPTIDNWSETSREVYFADDLFFLINGGAELYLEYGFDQVVSSEIINEQGNKAVVEVYLMEDAAAAHGIYLFNAKGGRDAGIAVESTLGKDYLDVPESGCLWNYQHGGRAGGSAKTSCFKNSRKHSGD